MMKLSLLTVQFFVAIKYIIKEETMSNKITDEQRGRRRLDCFVNIQEDTADETDNIDADIPSYEPNVTVNTDIQEDDIIAQEEKPKGSFFSKKTKTRKGIHRA